MIKYSSIMFLFLGLIICLGTCTPTVEQVKASAANLMAVNKEVDSVYQLLNNSYESYRPQVMDEALASFQAQLDKSMTKLESMATMESTSNLRESIVNKIEVMRYVSTHECVEQVRIYKLPNNAFTDELRVQWESLALSVEKKKRSADQEINKVLLATLNPKPAK